MPELIIQSPSEQVASHLRQELLQGRWSESMPGAPTLAAELGVDHKAVESGLQRLEEEGLLVPQGKGRPRRIELPERGRKALPLRVALLAHDSRGPETDYMIGLRHQLEEAGHLLFSPRESLGDLGMEVERVARLVRKTQADAWIVSAASKEVLDWFAAEGTPAFALFGRLAGLKIAGTKPNKGPALAEALRRLIGLGHRRISKLSLPERRLPEPGRLERMYLAELENHGIRTSPYHLPNWEANPEGLRRGLESLFGPTPPTALIVDGASLFVAVQQFLGNRGLRVPEHVSLVCTDGDSHFSWCHPSIAHIRWDHRPVVRRILRWVNEVARGKDDRRQTMTPAEFVDGGSVGSALSPPSVRS